MGVADFRRNQTRVSGLKGFLGDRLGLTADELNRLSTAGIPITGPLSSMPDSARRLSLS